MTRSQSHDPLHDTTSNATSNTPNVARERADREPLLSRRQKGCRDEGAPADGTTAARCPERRPRHVPFPRAASSILHRFTAGAKGWKRGGGRGVTRELRITGTPATDTGHNCRVQ